MLRRVGWLLMMPLVIGGCGMPNRLFLGEAYSNPKESAMHVTRMTTDQSIEEGRPTAPVTASSVPIEQPVAEPEVTVKKWSKIEIELSGPASIGLDREENPFSIVFDAEFRGPDGQTLTVPGFYDGDGQGGMDGDVWKIRFAPDAEGVWSYVTMSEYEELDGQSGAFMVQSEEACPPYEAGGLPELGCVGRLEYVGGHYLKFADGPYWLKGGIDDPENFLGDAFGDWEAKKAAVDYLVSRGANSIYVITNNITPGDRNDTWPWYGESSEQAKANSSRYDVEKLQEWEEFFAYVQQQGIVLHIVLDDDSAWHDYDHAQYYREMVARFGHHPGIIWNIGEEADEIYSNRRQRELARLLRETDPYAHPVTVHRKPIWPFLGDEEFDLTSIQPGDGAADFTTANLQDYSALVGEHRRRSISAGRPIPVMIDETPRVTLVDEMTQAKMRDQVLYPIFLGGGNYELHYYDAYGQGGEVTVEALAPMLDDMQRARRLVETLPFWEMSPCNDLVSGGGTLCLGRPDGPYAIFLPEGGSVDVDLTVTSGTFEIAWFQPQTGEYSDSVSILGGSTSSHTAPGNDSFVLLIVRPNTYLPLIRAHLEQLNSILATMRVNRTDLQ